MEFCGGNGPVRSVQGTITEIGNGHITINAGGQNYQLNIGSCTNLTSNQSGYQMRAGDNIIAKGTQAGSNSMNCQQGVVVA